MTLKDELSRSEGAQDATGDQWRNNSRKNEEAEPKQSENNTRLWMWLVMEVKSNVALNMPANLENSAMATGLEKVSFHSSPKER